MTEKKKDQYTTLSVLSIGLTVIGMESHHISLVFVSAVVLLAGLASPMLLNGITKAWIWIGEKIGAVMSRVILAIIFICFLTPIALFYRLLSKKDKLEDTDSYFIERNHTYSTTDLEQAF